MLEQILPPAVEVVASRHDVSEAALLSEERPLVASAVAKRRLEFATGRDCARRALARLGQQSVAIPTGEHGEPLWPPGVVGSITHCEGYRAAAVAPADAIATIGIDAEPNEPLPAGVLGDIALPVERRQLEALRSEAPELSWDRLLFCLKEAVYKAWFPLARRWLGFEDAVVSIDPSARAFQARLLVSEASGTGPEPTGFSGNWIARDGLLAAAIAVPAADS